MSLKEINLIILFATFFCVAATATANNIFPSGFHVGLGSGWQYLSADAKNLKILADPGGTINETQVDTSVSQKLHSVVVEGILGYLHQFNKMPLTLGGRLVFGYASGEKSFARPAEDVPNAIRFITNVSLKTGFQYAFDVILGWVLSDCYHLYLLGGIGQDWYKTTSKISVANPGGAGLLLNHGHSNSFKRTVYRLGFGVEKAVSEHIRFGIEGIWSFINKDINVTQPDVGEPIVTPGATFNYKRDLKKFQLLAVVTYNFWKFD